jgi:hypothetical protein
VADYSLEKYIGQGTDNRYLFKGSRQETAPLILLTSHNFIRTLQGDSQYRQHSLRDRAEGFAGSLQAGKLSVLLRGNEIQEVANSSSTPLYIN